MLRHRDTLEELDNMSAEKGKTGWAPGAKSGSFGAITSDPWGSLMKWLESDSDQNTEWKLPEVLRESPVLRDLFGWEQKDQQAGRFGMSPGEVKARNQHSLYNQNNVFSGPTPELPVDPNDDKINSSYYMAAGKDLLKQEVDGLMQEGYSREDAIVAVTTNKTLTDSIFKKALEQARVYDDGEIAGTNRIRDRKHYPSNEAKKSQTYLDQMGEEQQHPVLGRYHNPEWDYWNRR